MKTTKVVIIGAGFAGLRAYYHLVHHEQNFDITIIDKRAKSLEKPSLPEVAFSGKEVSHVLIELKPLITSKGGTYINDEVVKINPTLNHIHLKNGDKIGYDFLIIASGAIKDYSSIEGFNSFGFSMCDDFQAVKLWEKVNNFKGGNIVIGTAKSTFGNRVKAPKLVAPCEGPIGEAMFIMDYNLRQKNIRDKSTINVFTPGEVFFEDIGDNVRNKVGAIMAEHNIALSNNKVVTKITEKTIEFEDGTSMPCDLAIVIPPYRALSIFKESNLGDEEGFIPTDKTMKHLDFDNIYAVGDINALAQPKLGHIAIHQADIATSAIIKKVTGEGEIIKFNPSVFCIMIMGGSEATLIYSDDLYNGENDLAFHSPMSKMMKWSFDNYYYYTQGHMPPDFSMKGLEKFLSLFSKDEDEDIVFND
jgi:sulfide:quinone oxidoreductase